MPKVLRQHTVSPVNTPVDDLIAATRPLLALFAVVDDVLTEDDCMSQDKLRMGLGRIRREWEATKAALGGD